MYKTLYSKWQKQLSQSPHTGAILVTQKSDLVVKFLETIFTKPAEIHYFLPEIINIVESTNLNYKDFLNSFFLLRDTILFSKDELSQDGADVETALHTLQEVILKLGTYFAHLSMDLNTSDYNLSNIDIDRFEWYILELNEKFVIEKANSAVTRYFDYTKKELIGKPLQFLFTDSSQNIITKAISQLKMKLKYKMDLEVEAQRRNGQHFQALLTLMQKHAEDENLRYTVYIKNNSYFYETKGMLSLLSLAIENVGQGIVIIEPNPLGTILYVNETMEKMSGFSRQYLLGKSFSHLRNVYDSHTLEEEIIQASLNEGWQGEVINKHKDNHNYIIHLQTQPVVGENGKIVAIVGIEQNITDQRNRENQILHLKQFVELIINNLQHFVVVTDSNLNIKFWNKSLEHELSLEKEDTYGRNILEVIPALRRQHLEIAAKNVVSTEKSFIKKILIDIDANNERYYQLYLTEISTDQEKQLLWTLLDITQEEMLKVKITWQNARLKFLENLSQILNSNLELKKLLDRFTTELHVILPFKTITFFIPYEIENLRFSLFLFSEEGVNTFPHNQISNFATDEIYKRVLDTKKSLMQNFITDEDKKNRPKEEPESKIEINQIIRIPLGIEDQILGILNIGHEEPNFFNQNDLDFLQQIANHLVVALKNSYYFNLVKLQNQKLFIINSLLKFEPQKESIPRICDVALRGFAELLNSDLVALYLSKDGRNWQLNNHLGEKEIFPERFRFAFNTIPEKTISWDKYHSAPLAIEGIPNINNYFTGIFSWEISTSQGYVGFWVLNNQIREYFKQDLIVDYIQDIMKQLTISLDHIDLFEKLRIAETEWEMTFDSVNIGLVIVDDKFRITRANEAFERLYKLDLDKYYQKTCKETFCENLAKEICCLENEIKSQCTSELKHEYFNKELSKKISQTFHPLYKTDYEFNGGIFVLQDVTKQREQESKIQFLSKFPETNPNIVISIDRHGKQKYVNPAAQKLFKEFHISEKNIKDFLPGNLEMILQQIQEESKNYTELEHKFKDRIYQYFSYYIPEDDQFYFYGTDITEKLEMQQHFLRTEKIGAIGEMASGVAHDFNNLLATILGKAQLMMLKTENKELIEELQVIEKAAIDGGEIVRRIQEVTRERRDKNYQVIDIAEIIKDSLIFSANKLKFSTQLKGKEIHLHTEIEEATMVKGNPVELKEIFTNLFINAYDAMNNGGELFINCIKLDDKKAKIVIQDTGIGMPEEIRNKIFNPFFTTKGEKGTGLGLSIVYRTITAHGGHIEVESEPNKGTMFRITFPLTVESLKKQNKIDFKIYESNGNVRLLIVDDEPELLDTMAEILRLKYSSVEIANSGKDAINKLQNQMYDIVLTDLGMPEMSGWELAKKIKNIRPDSKVILVTGWGDQARQELKHHPYVDEILPKPYELQHLIEKITNFSSNLNPAISPGL